MLSQYDISYGALYRWKRKGLIPEEWFIKKSTTTGQETFFPKKLVCDRIELILGMKDDILLDDLAKKLTQEEVNDQSIIIKTALGDKKYLMSDISKITLIDGDKQPIDITDTIRNLFKGE